MAFLLRALVLCSALGEAVAVRSAGISLLRAGAFKSKTKAVAEFVEVQSVFAPVAHGDPRASPGKAVPLQALQPQWHTPWIVHSERLGIALTPVPLVALAVVMIGAAAATTVAAGVAVAAARKVQAAECLQQSNPGTPHHIPGLPGEAEALSEQEAKIKTVSNDDGFPHVWEELSEPEAEWDANTSASSSNT
mmetsp:Transcript_43362/g.120563  ORF Transcript_43362/g.120563 Transcript_43362/m.120563 type:complete len:192 (-) Transcript_43362:151-726(-)